MLFISVKNTQPFFLLNPAFIGIVRGRVFWFSPCYVFFHLKRLYMFINIPEINYVKTSEASPGKLFWCISDELNRLSSCFFFVVCLFWFVLFFVLSSCSKCCGKTHFHTKARNTNHTSTFLLQNSGYVFPDSQLMLWLEGTLLSSMKSYIIFSNSDKLADWSREKVAP